MILRRKSEKDGKTSARLPPRIFPRHIYACLNLEDIVQVSIEAKFVGSSAATNSFEFSIPYELSRTIFFFTYVFRKRARASESRCEISHASRVKPCVTHDIYKGFSIRKTHIIETTCNILTYAVIQ